jgi:hypothetical protein
MGGGKNQVPEAPEQIAEANVFQQKYADYLARWQPVVQFFQQRVDSSQQPTRQLLGGEGVTDVRGQFGNAGQRMQMALRDAGVESGSGRDVFGLSKFANSEAGAASGAVTTADAASDRSYLEGLQQIIAIGNNQQAKAGASLSDLANMSGQVAEENAQASAANAEGLGSAIGTGVGAAGAYALRPALASAPPPAPPAQYGLTMS